MSAIDWKYTENCFEISSKKICFLACTLSDADNNEISGITAPFWTISQFLDDLTDDISIVEKALSLQAKTPESIRLARLEEFMESMARQMEEDQEDWDLKTTAKNIRYVLGQ